MIDSLAETAEGEAGSVLNGLTVDVEEHFQVSAFADVVRREDWPTLPSRVEASTDRVLDVLDRAEVQATFFVLGWVAERHGRLVRRIHDRGHEIACHGYSHRLIYDQRPDDFRDELLRAKSELENRIGVRVRGHRAASFSISRRSLWALDILAEAGFEYDSSIFPVVHDRYGIPGAPRGIHRLRTRAGAEILEIPPSTLKLGRVVIPVAGGGYLRLYPNLVTRWAIGWLNRFEQVPAIVYLHPWELDPEQPRIGASWRSRFRHYTGLAGTAAKLEDLLARFPFGPVRDVLREEGSDVPERLLAS